MPPGPITPPPSLTMWQWQDFPDWLNAIRINNGCIVKGTHKKIIIKQQIFNITYRKSRKNGHRFCVTIFFFLFIFYSSSYQRFFVSTVNLHLHICLSMGLQTEDLYILLETKGEHLVDVIGFLRAKPPLWLIFSFINGIFLSYDDYTINKWTLYASFTKCWSEYAFVFTFWFYFLELKAL